MPQLCYFNNGYCYSSSQFSDSILLRFSRPLNRLGKPSDLARLHSIYDAIFAEPFWTEPMSAHELMNRETIIERYRERIALGRRTKLFSGEFEILIADFIQQLAQVHSREQIQQLCNAEIRLLEEGYKLATLASDYIPKYRKALNRRSQTASYPSPPTLSITLPIINGAQIYRNPKPNIGRSPISNMTARSTKISITDRPSSTARNCSTSKPSTPSPTSRCWKSYSTPKTNSKTDIWRWRSPV